MMKFMMIFGSSIQRINKVLADYKQHYTAHYEHNPQSWTFCIHSDKAPEFKLSVSCPPDCNNIYAETLLFKNDEPFYNADCQDVKRFGNWTGLKKEIDNFLSMTAEMFNIQEAEMFNIEEDEMFNIEEADEDDE